MNWPKFDLHIHTINSGHALSTLNEIVNNAKIKWLRIIGISDHGSHMEGAPHEGYFEISSIFPREEFGIKIFFGVEANILNVDGDLDVSQKTLSTLNYISAGLHFKTPYLKSSYVDNTNAILNSICKNYINILTHPLRSDFDCDLSEIAYNASKNHVLIELNNNVFSSINDEMLLRYKKAISIIRENGGKVILGSDAHYAPMIGNFDWIKLYSRQLHLTEEVIINSQEIEGYLYEKKGTLISS